MIISNKLATLIVPEGYAFLKTNDVRYIMKDVLGHVKDEDVLRMLYSEK